MLLTPDSRFDRWLRGDATALSPAELIGYQTFGPFGCSACHQGVGVGGNLIARQGIFRPLAESGSRRVRVRACATSQRRRPISMIGSARDSR